MRAHVKTVAEIILPTKIYLNTYSIVLRKKRKLAKSWMVKLVLTKL